MRNRSGILAFAAIVATAAACGEGKHDDDDKSEAKSAPAAAAAPAGPCATCKIIEVTMTTTATGNFFTPKKFEAHEGDVLRFKLEVGVHNVDFLPDSNPGVKNLPPVSEMLQLPGQTVDIPLNFGTGTFYFQCDPHALLGMVGHVKVEKKD